MRRDLVVVLGTVSLVAVGCHTPTRVAVKVTEVPRVDLELAGGNRGYLVGTPPAPAKLKTTRQMMEGTIELPSFYRPRRGAGGQTGLEMAPPEMEPGEAEQPVQVGAQRYDTYVVQKGESLWSIAAKPEIYGKATKWRRIFDANRELLKSPDRLRPGMTLKIPRGEDAGSMTYDDEGITYKK